MQRLSTQPLVRRQGWPTTQITLLRDVAEQCDERSWERFVRLYGPLIQRYCLRRGLQDADAYDVVQDVLLQISRGIGDFRYDVERGRFRNWLGTVTHRAMLKHVAKSRRASGGRAAGESADATLPILEGEQALDEVWVEAFNAHIYREAIQRLRLQFSAETWRAFEATFSEDRPPHEVAQELQRPVGWVYQAKSRVVRQLREEILYLAEDSVFQNWCKTN